ncbi:MAG: hypothetical protein CSB46_10955, partial [Micrococcales bacterium]
LYPLCRRHHILRTHRAWTYEPDPETHGLIWTSPTGNTYHVDRYTTYPNHPSRPADRGTTTPPANDPVSRARLWPQARTRQETRTPP